VKKPRQVVRAKIKTVNGYYRTLFRQFGLTDFSSFRYLRCFPWSFDLGSKFGGRADSLPVLGSVCLCSVLFLLPLRCLAFIGGGGGTGSAWAGGGDCVAGSGTGWGAVTGGAGTSTSVAAGFVRHRAPPGCERLEGRNDDHPTSPRCPASTRQKLHQFVMIGAA
jgi:hypothetical protein